MRKTVTVKYKGSCGSARWYGVFVVSLSAIAMMFFVSAYPFWALVIIAVGIVAIYRLCAYGSRANITAA